MRTYQNEHNMLPNFPRCLSILLLQTSRTDNNALDIDAIYNLKLRKTDSLTIKLNAKFPWPAMPKQRECILSLVSFFIISVMCLTLVLNEFFSTFLKPICKRTFYKNNISSSSIFFHPPTQNSKNQTQNNAMNIFFLNCLILLANLNVGSFINLTFFVCFVLLFHNDSGRSLFIN
jgi:hypothetical protein